MEKGTRILIIEDDASLCEVLAEIFNNEQYVFQFYEDTADIFELVDSFKPDIILLDYLLPSTNGGEICTQLKDNRDTRQIPVIIYSALSKKLLPIEEYHCDSFLEKPFDLSVLLNQIEKHSHQGHAA